MTASAMSRSLRPCECDRLGIARNNRAQPAASQAGAPGALSQRARARTPRGSLSRQDCGATPSLPLAPRHITDALQPMRGHDNAGHNAVLFRTNVAFFADDDLFRHRFARLLHGSRRRHPCAVIGLIAADRRDRAARRHLSGVSALSAANAGDDRRTRHYLTMGHRHEPQAPEAGSARRGVRRRGDCLRANAQRRHDGRPTLHGDLWQCYESCTTATDHHRPLACGATYAPCWQMVNGVKPRSHRMQGSMALSDGTAPIARCLPQGQRAVSRA